MIVIFQVILVISNSEIAKTQLNSMVFHFKLFDRIFYFCAYKI